VAAVPSLHAAYSLFVVLLVWRIWPRLAPLAFAYAFAMQFAVVYLGEHYIIDLVVGDALVCAAWWVVARRLVRRREGAALASDALPAAPAA
jgi:membrane-associated phospholipid phosphatase